MDMAPRISPRKISFSFLFLLASGSADAMPAPCEPLPSPRVIARNAEGRSLGWDFPAGFSLRGTFPRNTEPESSHVAWIRSRTAWTAVENLRQGIAIRQRALSFLTPGDPFRASLEADIRNVRKIVDGRIGMIRPVRCAEGLAMREFLKTVDLRKNPQEFMAVVLEKDGAFKMLGDFYRKPADSVVGVNTSSAVLNETRRWMKRGWRYHAHLHNHPFSFDNPYGDIGGALAPSEADLATYRSQKPERAWITNGLETIEIKRAEFHLFE